MDLSERAEALRAQMNELATERLRAFKALNYENSKARYRSQFLSKYGSVSYAERPEIHQIVHEMALHPDDAAREKARADYHLAAQRYKEVEAEYNEVVAKIKVAKKAKK